MKRPGLITASPFKGGIIIHGDGMPVLGLDRRQALILIERIAAALAQPTAEPVERPRIPRFPG